MLVNKNILKKVLEGHLKQNDILAVRVIEMMWNKI
jgi:hypothetical protein